MLFVRIETITRMIIRAVSSDEEEEDAAFPVDAASTAGSHPSFSAVTGTSISASVAVKLAWLAASVALITLLLVDLAAVAALVAPADAVDPVPSDHFSTLLVFKHMIMVVTMQTHGASSAPTATTINNVLGQVFVCAWIYSRESTLVAQRDRENNRSRRRSGFTVWASRNARWLVVGGVLALGHAVSCVYILFALLDSHGGNVRTKFWVGRSGGASRTMPRV